MEWRCARSPWIIRKHVSGLSWQRVVQCRCSGWSIEQLSAYFPREYFGQERWHGVSEHAVNLRTIAAECEIVRERLKTGERDPKQTDARVVPTGFSRGQTPCSLGREFLRSPFAVAR
jgi:hypothetical protein